MKYPIVRLTLLVILLLNLIASARPAYSGETSSVIGRQSTTIEGWRVLISDTLIEQEQAATKEAVELLTKQLQEIVRVVPAKAVVELRKVPLWLSPEYPQIPPRAEYHPNAGWLREHHRDPAMAKGIEFTNIRIFRLETNRMPNFTLHELAHAYHDRVLPQGFANRDIQAAFERAKREGRYDSVEQRFGDGRSANARAYALTNPMEYFAEGSEALFSTNDFFPFDREQLTKHDPAFSSLLQKLWGVPKTRNGTR